MAAVAALLNRKVAVQALRRALPRRSLPVVIARSVRHLVALLHRRPIDAVILGADAARGATLDLLRRDFVAMPLLLYTPLRADDADMLLHAHRERIAAVAVESLDEPVLPRLIVESGLTARRLAELLPLADALDLVDDLQQRAWRVIVADAPTGITTAALARRLGVCRETLSRGFAAGQAPSLKSAIDAVRLIAAAQLFGNAAFRVDDVVRLLRFSSASSLQLTARRTFGVPARAVAMLPADAIVARLRAGAAGGWH